MFSSETIAADQFPFILKMDPGWQSNTVSIPLGNFYLAVNTGDGPLVGGLPPRDVFGWIQLNNTGTQLLPVSNAVAYNEPGIIIGTTTPAPEPASLALLAVTIPSLLHCRHAQALTKTPPPLFRAQALA